MYEITEQLKAFFTADGIKVVDSRDVAKIIDKKHHNLLQDINRYKQHFIKVNEEAEKKAKTKEELIEMKIHFNDFFILSSYKDSIGRTLHNYYLTEKGCAFVSNKLTGVKGTEFTAKYINAFHSMRDKLQEQYANHVTVSKECIDGLEFAAFLSNKGFDIGRNQLFEWLRENNYLMSKGCHYNKPYRKYIKCGYFKVGKVSIKNSDGTISMEEKVWFTPIGQLYIFDKLMNRKKGIPMKYATTLF